MTGQSVTLDSNESHHALKVFRAKILDPILLIDGRGGLATARIAMITNGLLTATIESVSVTPAPVTLTLAFGLPKGPALEFIIKRCTEIGVTCFQPLLTQHSQPASFWNRNRWERVVLEVCKQCERLHVPELMDPMALGDFISARSNRSPLFFCSEAHRIESLPTLPSDGISILVGAEGGWSDDENRRIQGAGALLMGLGQNRLRCETAALVATILAGLQRPN